MKLSDPHGLRSAFVVDGVLDTSRDRLGLRFRDPELERKYLIQRTHHNLSYFFLTIATMSLVNACFILAEIVRAENVFYAVEARALLGVILLGILGIGWWMRSHKPSVAFYQTVFVVSSGLVLFFSLLTEILGNGLFVAQLPNAIKFSPRQGTITVRQSESEEGVVISVADSGSGIDEVKAASLFLQPVESTNGTMKEIGTGIGLSLCHKLAEKLGGRMEVSSGIGCGSTFSLVLPAGVRSSRNDSRSERSRTPIVVA